MAMRVLPSDDEDVIELMPAMVDSWRSIGDATDAAIVSGLAPGRRAVISMRRKVNPRQAPRPAAAGTRKRRTR